MENKIFAPRLKEIPLSDKIIHCLERLRDGETIEETGLTSKELNEIGLCYWNGHIVPLNYKKALKWYRASAKLRYKVAEFNLYVCYNKGTGVKKNKWQAIKWLKRASYHDDANSQFLLAENYYNGDMVRRNIRLSQKWFTRSENAAIRDESVVTLHSIAFAYYYGEYGFIKNLETAIYYFEKAGELDFPLSITSLVHIYMDIPNVSKVNYWMDKLRNCKTAHKYVIDCAEKNYSSFIKSLNKNKDE